MILLLHGSCLTVTGQNKNFCLDSAEVKQYLRDYEDMLYYKHQHELDSALITAKDSIISQDKREIQNLEQQVFLTGEQSYKPVIKPFIDWKGFWIGLNTSYGFDSTITKSTVINSLSWELTGTARIGIGERWEIEGKAVIPLREKFKIKAGINYLIF